MDRPFCDARPQSVAALIHDEETGEETVEVVDEGYDCPEFAVVRQEIETHAGPTMELDFCEDHAEENREDGVVVSEPERYGDTETNQPASERNRQGGDRAD
jgi:hypothetical protein